MNKWFVKIINLSVPKLGVLCALAGVNPRVRAFQIPSRLHGAIFASHQSLKAQA
jgi:hypothetical protein